MKTSTIISQFLFTLALCISLCSCTSESERIKNSRPDYSLDAKDFSNEYDANIAAANQKYKGKIIEINGQISDIGSDFIYLFGYVTCSFKGDQITTITKVKKYRRITIKGVYDKYQGLVPELDNCVIVAYFDF